MSKKWYVIQAFSGYEKNVQQAIKERIRKAEMEDFFGEIFVPSEQVEENVKGKKRTYERKFFPSYVLVEMEMNDDTWHLVRSCPRVSGFIGGTLMKPVPLTDKEVESIMSQVQESIDKPKPKMSFEMGQSVRVTDGPFEDFTGVVEGVNYEKNLVKVSVAILGRSTPVELDFSQVE